MTVWSEGSRRQLGAGFYVAVIAMSLLVLAGLLLAAR
jgi:hypothetical protein